MSPISENIINLTCTLYPHRYTLKKDGVEKTHGHYLQLSRLFPLGAPDLDKIQFIGVEECMVMTIDRPAGVTDLIKLAMDTRTVRSLKNVMWVGSVKMYPRYHGVRYYIPKVVWSPTHEIFLEPVHMKVQVIVTSKSSEYGYSVMKVPALTKKLLLGD